MGTIQGIAEIVLIVSDVPRSLAFYRDALGLTVISPAEMKGPVFLRVGDEGAGGPQQIVLVPRPPSVGAPPADRLQRGLHHIGLEVLPADFQPEWQRLTDLGFAIRTGEHPFLPVQAFYLDDPDGNEVEIVTRR